MGREITSEEKQRLEKIEKEKESERELLKRAFLAVLLFEKGMGNEDEFVRRGTAQSLGALASVTGFSKFKESIKKQKHS